MKQVTLFFLVLIGQAAVAQSKKVLSYDLFKGTRDSIVSYPVDTILTSDRTFFSTGTYNHSFAPLTVSPPVENVFPGSQFTKKVPAHELFNLSDFPIRTSVLLYERLEDGTMSHRCSGSFIGPRHVLTAAHCMLPVNSNDVFESTELYVAPIYDQGTFHPDFASARVKKVYYIKDWTLMEDDIALLELSEPLGAETGWIGFGFDEVDASLSDGIFYKFSYPGVWMPAVDSNVYNGDTLYCGYGVIGPLDENYISIQGATGISGESGSSIVKVDPGNSYTTYGVLSLALNIRHTRIGREQFYAFYSIVREDLYQQDASGSGIVYPNPAQNYLMIDKSGIAVIESLRVLDVHGKEWMHRSGPVIDAQVDLSGLQAGMYLLELVNGHSRQVFRFVKSE